MNLKIKRAFRFNQRSFKPGDEADLAATNPQPTEEQLTDWQKRGLVDGVSSTASSPGVSGLESELTELLRPFANGSDRGPVGTLERLLQEQQDQEDRLDDLADTFEEGSGLASLPDETSLSYIERVVEEGRKNFQPPAPQQEAVTESPDPAGETAAIRGNSATTVPPVETTGQAAPVAQPVKLTAEDLTGATGNAKSAIALLTAGFDTREALAAAADSDLIAIPNVGDVSVTNLRTWLAA